MTIQVHHCWQISPSYRFQKFAFFALLLVLLFFLSIICSDISVCFRKIFEEYLKLLMFWRLLNPASNVTAFKQIDEQL